MRGGRPLNMNGTNNQTKEFPSCDYDADGMRALLMNNDKNLLKNNKFCAKIGVSNTQ